MQDQDVVQWQRAVTLFRDVFGLPDAERDQAIDDLDESAVVKERLKELLHGSASSADVPMRVQINQMISHLGEELDATQSQAHRDETLLGRTIGAWTLIEVLGRGGMATVYLAERRDVEFEQQGALKLLSLLMVASGGSARFVREQQLLAHMQHPNIAMLLDGGVADDGTPYLVTERVIGTHIRDYCREHALSMRKIVGLLLQVCAGVSHAHGHLILHRDIKPSNIMVTLDGQVKLLDFGIGKFAEDSAEGTQTHAFTPKYAAPEQRDGGSITTATDVFGLGMLGQTLLAQSGESSRELARILDMATHDEPARRYASVESLARDLRNWLENRPIVAVGDSMAYRTRKLLRRNRVAALASAVVLMTLVLGLAAVLWQSRQTREQLAISEQTTLFLVQLFEEADPEVAKGSPTTARELLGRARASLSTINDNRVRDRLVFAIAQAYHGMSDFAEAEDLLRNQLSRPLTEQPVDAQLLLASAVYSTGKATEAIELLQPLKSNPKASFRAHAMLGRFLSSDGQFEQADAAFAVAQALRDGSQAPEDVLEMLVQLGENEIAQARYAQASVVLDEARAMARSTKHPLSEAQSERLLADMASLDGRLDDALGHVERARSLLGTVYREDHSVMLRLVRLEASILRETGKRKLAVEKLERAADLARKHLGDSTVTTELLNSLSIAYNINGQIEAAIAIGLETSEIFIRKGDARNPNRANVLSNTASYQLGLGRLDEAQANLAIAQDIMADSLPATHPVSIHLAFQVQRIAIRRGRFQAALDRLTELAAMAMKSPGPGNGMTLWIFNSAGRQSLRVGRFDAAIAWFEKERDGYRRRGEESKDFLVASADLAEAMLAAGRVDEANALLQQVLAKRAKANPEFEASLQLREARFALQAGDARRAKTLFKSSQTMMADMPRVLGEWKPEIEALSKDLAANER